MLANIPYAFASCCRRKTLEVQGTSKQVVEILREVSIVEVGQQVVDGVVSQHFVIAVSHNIHQSLDGRRSGLFGFLDAFAETLPAGC